MGLPPCEGTHPSGYGGGPGDLLGGEIPDAVNLFDTVRRSLHGTVQPQPWGNLQWFELSILVRRRRRDQDGANPGAPGGSPYISSCLLDMLR